MRMKQIGSGSSPAWSRRKNLSVAPRNLPRSWRGGPTAAYRYMKRSLLLGESSCSFRDVVEAETYGMIACSQTEDAREVVMAAREKRRPQFKGY